MAPQLDPVDAQRARAVARDQRRAATRAVARSPRWAWPAVFALVFLLWASRDFAAEVRTGMLLLGMALLLAWIYLPKVAPALAGRLGIGARGHSGAVPRHTKMIMLGVCLAGSVLGFFGAYASRALVEGVGAPAWAVRYPNTVVGLLVAAGLTGAAMIAERIISARMDREAP